MITSTHYLFLSAGLFAIGLTGVMARQTHAARLHVQAARQHEAVDVIQERLDLRVLLQERHDQRQPAGRQHRLGIGMTVAPGIFGQEPATTFGLGHRRANHFIFGVARRGGRRDDGAVRDRRPW